MKKWMLDHRPLVGWTGAAIALAIAIVYFFIVPAEIAYVDGIGWFLLRFGHSLVWLLLAATGVGFAVKWPDKVVATLAWSALGVYVAFLATLFIIGPTD